MTSESNPKRWGLNGAFCLFTLRACHLCAIFKFNGLRYREGCRQPDSVKMLLDRNEPISESIMRRVEDDLKGMAMIARAAR